MKNKEPYKTTTLFIFLLLFSSAQAQDSTKQKIIKRDSTISNHWYNLLDSNTRLDTVWRAPKKRKKILTTIEKK